MNVDKAVRYHRLKRRSSVLATLLTAATLIALLLTSMSQVLREIASAGAAGSASGSVAIYVVLLWVILQSAGLPLSFFSAFILEKRYGLSTESPGAWARDCAKAMVLGAALAVAAGELVYSAIARWPRAWWAVAALGCGLGVLLLVRVAPVVLFPLFYRFRPLGRPVLRQRLAALSSRAGLPVLGVYEWGLGDKTRRANAALVGLGGTRRILLSDTLLAEYSDDEIEVILAHELGHHAHRDVLKAVAVHTALLLLAFGASAWVLTHWSAPMQVSGPSDVAGLPLLVLTSGAVSLAMTPVLNALSRMQERRADGYALRLTERPDAFVSAMRRLAAQNLVEPKPSRAAVWFFHSHPGIEERIDAARAWEASLSASSRHRC